MGTRDVIVIGASAGGVEALLTIVRGLPVDLAATVLVVLHVPPDVPSALPSILARVTTLRVVHAQPETKLEPGLIVVAPPDHHLVVRRGAVALDHGPRRNGHRPAIDELFTSAAASLGSRVVGVVLSGALDDGAAGMEAIKRAGGATLVQAPEDALCSGMPRSVLERVPVDRILPAAELSRALVELVGVLATSGKHARAATGA